MTQLKKNCSSQQAGSRVCTRMLEKNRTGSTAKYLYQRKQSAPQLDMGAYQGSLHHPTLPDRLEESPHHNHCPCLLPGREGHLCPLPMATELSLPSLGMKGRRTRSLPAFPGVGSPLAFPH